MKANNLGDPYAEKIAAMELVWLKIANGEEFPDLDKNEREALLKGQRMAIDNYKAKIENALMIEQEDLINRLLKCAEYLGAEKEKHVRYNYRTEKPEHHYRINLDSKIEIVVPQQMKFSESWDWIMPVYQKIVSQGHGLSKMEALKKVRESMEVPTIEKVFTAVSDFCMLS